MLETLFNLDALTEAGRLRLDDAGTHLMVPRSEGGAAVAWRVLPAPSVAPDLLRTVQLGPVTMIYGAALVRMQLAGADRWTIDVNRFAGAPKLTVHKESDARYRITLTGARFPGTDIPADLEATIYSAGLLLWALDLRLAWGGFVAERVP
ncbi:MAG: hypothetical protein KC636_11260, partial [Myxococcales bacterium]|nr:hypothetical protein [Myxococcales bacterium]